MSEDSDAREPLFDGAGLCLCDGGLEGEGGSVALAGFRCYEAEGDEVVRVGEGEKIFPVLWVEAREGGEDEDGFLVGGGVGGGGEVVEYVMDYRRRYSPSV